MKVGALIEELQKLDPNLECCVSDYDGTWYSLQSAEVHKIDYLADEGTIHGEAVLL